MEIDADQAHLSISDCRALGLREGPEAVLKVPLGVVRGLLSHGLLEQANRATEAARRKENPLHVSILTDRVASLQDMTNQLAAHDVQPDVSTVEDFLRQQST